MTHPKDFAFNDSATKLARITDEGIEVYNPPLTKREYFAVMAMQGLISDHTNEGHLVIIADSAVQYADALINALNQKS